MKALKIKATAYYERRSEAEKKPRLRGYGWRGCVIAGCACDEVVRLPEAEGRAAKRSQEAARFRSDVAPSFNHRS